MAIGALTGKHHNSMHDMGRSSGFYSGFLSTKMGLYEKKRIVEEFEVLNYKETGELNFALGWLLFLSGQGRASFKCKTLQIRF